MAKPRQGAKAPEVATEVAAPAATETTAPAKRKLTPPAKKAEAAAPVITEATAPAATETVDEAAKAAADKAAFADKMKAARAAAKAKKAAVADAPATEATIAPAAAEEQPENVPASAPISAHDDALDVIRIVDANFASKHPKEDMQTYLKRLLLQLSRLPADTYDKVEDVTATWYDAAHAALKAGKPLPEIPGFIEAKPARAKKADASPDAKPADAPAAEAAPTDKPRRGRPPKPKTEGAVEAKAPAKPRGSPKAPKTDEERKAFGEKMKAARAAAKAAKEANGGTAPPKEKKAKKPRVARVKMPREPKEKKPAGGITLVLREWICANPKLTLPELMTMCAAHADPKVAAMKSSTASTVRGDTLATITAAISAKTWNGPSPYA